MKVTAAVFAMLLSMSISGHADTVILTQGASYSGQFTGKVVHFTDQQGIQYTFPRADVQTLVFNASMDTVTLRNGKSYVGHFTGSNPVGFTDAEGIQYQFPVHDIESLVFNNAGQAAPVPEHAKVIPFGTDIVVRTDESIDSANTQTGQLYRGAIAERVRDAAGGEAIPAGAPAQLLIRQVKTGGATGSPELVLDLYSVTIGGKQYRVVTSNVDESSNRGMGKNRRTAEFLGGGRGAGIGALSGAGGGMLTQVFTRGHVVKIPAESVLRFRLEHRLILQAQ